MDLNTAEATETLGSLPPDWRSARIEEIASVGSGGTPSRKNPAYWRGTIPWVTTAQIDFGTIAEASECITEAGLRCSAARILAPGTLLLALYGQGKTRGKVAKLGISAATNQACASIAPGSHVDGDYLFHFLASRYQALRSASNAGSQENLSGRIVKDTLVALPPKAEQAAIATALSDVDTLLTKLDQLIAKKRDLKQAAVQQLLTGRRRLPGFTEPWRERTLQSAVARLEAGVSVRSVEGDVGSSDCFVLKTSAVADGNFDASERKPVIPADRGRVRCPVRAGTVLVSRMNTPDLVGEVGFVDRDHPNSFLPDRLWAASVPKGAVSARWLSYVLSSSEYKQRLRDVATGTSGSMKNISKGAFLGISVKVPTLDEQSAIAQVLSDMDADLVALEARREKTRQLKQGMMQALLTGRIRLT